ncbi:MAG: DeoR/GlpR family DNA-binding transcription regulator [Propionibacteriaceae bacterium]|jgi:DeoR/GlpR family transcriptional regulator of sugar metabolism|nr:DeoR/GlpR family DNA-binding transcription regulator [Propionibacteriaceae bacterium]
MVVRRGRGSAAGQRARQEEICRYVTESGSRTVDEIAAVTGVSTMTVYRDVSELERAGLLHLARGQVTAAGSNVHEASSRYRRTQAMVVKKKLAEAALELVEPGSALFLDDSSTGLPLAKMLPRKSPLTVVTHYLPVFKELAGEPQIRLLMTGGEFIVWADAFMGSTTLKTIRSMRADAVFMSATAIINGRVFHPTDNAADVKRAMIECASFRVLYADSTKFTRTALHEVAPISAFDVVIVDADLPSETMASLRQIGPRVIQVESA